jgi:hypothetical protein
LAGVGCAAVGYLIVFLIAAAVGVTVYGLTLREAVQPAGGTSGGFGEPAPDATYVSVTGGKPDWQSRLTGFFGLAAAVVLGGVALAAVSYLAIEAIVRLVGGLAPTAAPSTGP